MMVVQKVKTIYAQHSCRSTTAYPAYRPDLAPSDFHLFSTLKEFSVADASKVMKKAYKNSTHAMTSA
jgi:hypothetical protein